MPYAACSLRGRQFRWRLVLRLLCAVVMAGLCWTAPASAGATSPAVELSLASEVSGSIRLDLRFGRFSTRDVSIDGVSHWAIGLGEESLITHKGAPALPSVCRSVIIPDDAEMGVRVLSSRYYEIPDVSIVPSKGYILRTVDPDRVPYAFGKVYAQDAFYPATEAELRTPYILRDHRGIVVTAYPFRYNPVQRVLRVYTEMTVEIYEKGPGRINVLHRRPADRELSLSFHRMYKHHFLNYAPPLRYEPLDEEGAMLVICHDAWLSNVQPLVDHKNYIGISTTAVGVSTIGNDAASIKSYIQSVYDTTDLAFVLLVGDAAQVASPISAGGSADPTYALLAGDDHYPDIVVGRFSAESPEDVDTQVLRTIEYELMPATQQTWFKKAMGIASDDGGPTGDDGESDQEHIENIRPDLLGYGYTVVDEFYETEGATKAMISAAVNEGRGLINYAGHGGIAYWTTTYFNNADVNNLTNDNMLPVIVNTACSNGNFASFTCFAEAWLRATNGDEPTGAAAMYASSINQAWAPPMDAQDEINDLLVAEAYHTFGALCFAGSCHMMDEYPPDTPAGSGEDAFDTWHVFGDPSLRVFGVAGPPSGLRVRPSAALVSEGPAGGPFTPGSIIYTLENQDETPLDYAVSKGRTWISLSSVSGQIPALGSTTVTVSINSAANGLVCGHHSDTIEFTNVSTGEGNTTRDVALQVGDFGVVHGFLLDDTDPGWSTAGQWAFGQPTGGGGVSHGYPDPTSGATGDNVYGVNLDGDYWVSVGGPHYLTTGPMDFSNYLDVTLVFKRWLNSDYSDFVSNKIEVSNNGTDWETVWSSGLWAIEDSTWRECSYDISQWADGRPAVYVRWSYEVLVAAAWAYSGWNIDDIEFWGLGGTPPPPPCNFQLGDMDHSGEVNGADIQAFIDCHLVGDPYVSGCNCADMDMPADGYGLDDINDFVDCLLGISCP